MKKTGLLLLNLGSPAAPTPRAVGAYLREFLMDGYVIDVPAPLRWLLVNVAIVPRRKYASAKLYQNIWTEVGSPLIVNVRALAEGLQQNLGASFQVAVGMRYGEPSTAAGLRELRETERILVLALYPQYAESSYETAVQAVKRAAREQGCLERLHILPPFYDQPAYLDSSAEVIRRNLALHPSAHVVFSYHSLPVRHLKRLNVTEQHCFKKSNCCEQITAANARCYRAQCTATTRALAARLGLSAERYSLSFQSRLGRQEWIGPQTEDLLRELAARGIREVTVACPSFVSDCLETLEEIAVRARRFFCAAGGEELTLIPALNAQSMWVNSMSAWLKSQ